MFGGLAQRPRSEAAQSFLGLEPVSEPQSGRCGAFVATYPMPKANVSQKVTRQEEMPVSRQRWTEKASDKIDAETASMNSYPATFRGRKTNTAGTHAMESRRTNPMGLFCRLFKFTR